MTIWQKILGWLGSQPQPPPDPTPRPSYDATAEMLRQHNEARERQGLQPLRLNATLQNAATSHAGWMARHGRLAHDDGDAVGYQGASFGQNIARGQRTVTEVVSAWLSSPGHRRNVLGDYQDVGFGMATGLDGQLYWCADFGLKGNPQGMPPGAFYAVSKPIPEVSLSGPLER